MPGLLCPFGHVATTAELLAVFGWEHFLATIRERADVVQLRRGVYACAHLNEDERLAVTVGGRIDCVSALRENGLLADPADRVLGDLLAVGLHDHALHLRVTAHSGRSAPRGSSSGRPLILHWTQRPDPVPPGRLHFAEKPAANRLRVPLVSAMRQAMQCLSAEAFVDSLIAAVPAFLTPRQAQAVVDAAPRRLHSALGRPELVALLRSH